MRAVPAAPRIVSSQAGKDSVLVRRVGPSSSLDIALADQLKAGELARRRGDPRQVGCFAKNSRRLDSSSSMIIGLAIRAARTRSQRA